MNIKELRLKILRCKKPCRTIMPLAGYLYPENSNKADVFFVGIAPSYRRLSKETQITLLTAWDPRWNKRNKLLHEVIRKHFNRYYFTNISKCPLEDDIINISILKERWNKGCKIFFQYELAILSPKIIFLMGQDLKKFFGQKSTWWFDSSGILYYVIKHPAYFSRQGNLLQMQTYYDNKFQEVKRWIGL